MKISELRKQLEKLFKNTETKLVDTTFKQDIVYGQGFFPYCNGTLESGDYKIREKRILFLGKEWGTTSQYKELLKKEKIKIGEGENTNTTYKNLKELIANQNLRWDDKILLSNVFMGLKKGERSMGENPELLNVEYLEKCKSFLEIQIKKFKPKYVIALGEVPYQFIISNTKNFLGPIDTYKNYFIEIESYFPEMNKLKCTLGKYEFNLCSIPHPSMRINLDEHKDAIFSLFSKINKDL